jgi:hypothetical protein
MLLLALKQHRLSDARDLTRGMREALLKYREANVVLENFTVGYGVRISNTAWQLEAKVNKLR